VADSTSMKRSGGSALSPQNYLRLDALQSKAAGTVQYLHESWSHPARHDQRIELQALWHAAHLDWESGSLLEKTDDSLLPLPSAMGSVEARYEVEAAIRLIPAITPFDRGELRRLIAPTFQFDKDWADDIPEREAELVGRWHKWIWSQEQVSGEPQEEHSRASLLAVAAGRLAVRLGVVLGA
jgi:hypothetical protein